MQYYIQFQNCKFLSLFIIAQIDKISFKPFSCGSRLKSCETVPTVAAVHSLFRFRGVTKVQPAEDMQTMTQARSTISLVVRVIFWPKNNFYDIIRLKIIESRYDQKKQSRLVWRKANKMADIWKRWNVGEFQVRE